MLAQIPNIELREKQILDAIAEIEEAKRKAKSDILEIEKKLEQKTKQLEAGIFEAAEELRAYAETKRKGQKVTLAPGVFTQWYKAPARVREMADLTKIIAELKKLRLVEIFLRKKITYTVNKTAVKDNQDLLKRKRVTTLTVDVPRNLACLSFGQTDATVIKDLGTNEWHLSWPAKKQPKRPDKLPLPEGSF